MARLLHRPASVYRPRQPLESDFQRLIREHFDEFRDKQARRHWARLIQRVYQVESLVCPKCGGRMKIMALIEARQGDVIRKILEHCGLWHDPPPRAPPRVAPRSPFVRPQRDSARGKTVEMDPEYIEYLLREKQGELFGEA